MANSNLAKKAAKAVQTINNFYAQLHQIKLKRIELVEKINQK